MRVRPELCANLVKLVSSCCAASAAGGRCGFASVWLCCIVLVALGAILFWFSGAFALVGRLRPGVVARYVVASIRQSNDVLLWRACCEHWLGRVASCMPEGVVLRK